MCGISGYIGCTEDRSITVQKMNDTIAHRGPDASQVWSNKMISLGHVRLSIIDLSPRSHQPMEKHGLIIVFNGEIYNYQSLKEELGDAVFFTSSDTEVVLEAWRKWGEASLLRLRGMFAFAIHDIQSGETILVRDPYGIKPLFYTVVNKSVIFSSELKAIETAIDSKLKLSRSSVAASMLYAWIPEEECIWHGVKKWEGSPEL